MSVEAAFCFRLQKCEINGTVFLHGPIFQSLQQLWLPKLAPTVTARDVPSGLVDERYFLLQERRRFHGEKL